jgi:redox-sensitive bicupin YhaK (pirin superfamily)
MGLGDLSFADSTFHFSFANYYNPENINFGVLRVVNDDVIKPHSGFDTHPHNDMEIITYVVDGALTHGDSLGNKNTITRGHIQYFSAGTGVMHNEYDEGDDPLRLLQIWIYPDRKGHQPDYGDKRFEWEDRQNQWLLMISGKDGDAPITINQDANFYVTALDHDKEIKFKVAPGRQAYLIQVEGSSEVNGETLTERDAMEVIEENLSVKAIDNTHLLVMEMKKER